MIPIVLRPAAAADIENAMLWYEGQSPGLGGDFLTAVDATLNRIREQPAIFAKIHRDARRALIHKYPYAMARKAAVYHHHLAEKEKAPNSIGIRGQRRRRSISF